MKNNTLNTLNTRCYAMHALGIGMAGQDTKPVVGASRQTVPPNRSRSKRKAHPA